MENLTYEEAIKELENIIKKLENNDIALEESIELFQKGIELSKYCDSKLKNISKKVAQIYEDGQLTEFKTEE